VAGCRIPPGELDADCLPDQTASAIAPDEIFRPQRPAVGQLDVDAGVVLREAGHPTAVVDRHPQIADPAGQYARDVVLPQPEPVVVPGGKVADVQRDPGETCDLSHLPLREEPVGDPALIEDLDGARVQTARAQAGEVVTGAPLDNGNVDPRQRQLARQHQPRRTSSGDHRRMLGHSHTPAGITPVATSASHPSAATATVSNWAATNSAARRGRFAAVGGVPSHRRADWHQRPADTGREVRRRTPTPPRRVPATAPRVPPSARRPRATHMSTTTHAFRYSRFRRFWLQPALCGTTRGLPQAPRCVIYWKWKGVGTLLSTYRPPWTDNLLAKRRRAAYGDTVSSGGSPVGGESLLRQDCLEPQLGAGATLCWIVTLSIAQRGEYEDTFEDPQIVAKWLVCGSHIVLPNPWLPPTPSSL
jgi:hypothetical protein